MTQTLTLPSEVYRKLAKGAAERGMTIESLLTAVSELITLPNQPTERDRERSECIEELLERFRSGQLNTQDRKKLDDLIKVDYEAANARAEQLISAKQSQAGNAPSLDRKPNSPPRTGKRSRK